MWGNPVPLAPCIQWCLLILAIPTLWRMPTCC